MSEQEAAVFSKPRAKPCHRGNDETKFAQFGNYAKPLSGTIFFSSRPNNLSSQLRLSQPRTCSMRIVLANNWSHPAVKIADFWKNKDVLRAKTMPTKWYFRKQKSERDFESKQNKLVGDETPNTKSTINLFLIYASDTSHHLHR